MNTNSCPYFYLIPGSFKPPHAGHFEMISHYISLSKKNNGKVIVFVSNPKKNIRYTGSGGIITAEFSKSKLEEMFGDEIEVRISDISPVKDCYDFGNNIENANITFGCSTKDEDLKRFDTIKRYYNTKYPKINVSVLPFSVKTQISAKDIRMEL